MTDFGAPNPRATTFVGGNQGGWIVVSQRALLGPPLAAVSRVAMLSGNGPAEASDAAWILRGVATNDRYTTRDEKRSLVERQEPIGRPEATRAALILLQKSADWWAMTQDERRAVLEEQSHHIAIGLRFLPAIARRLLHCRDLEMDAPFDFLGFLDFAPADEPAFEDVLSELRATKEWSFMEREIDIRLAKDTE
ncbi:MULTISPECIES: chlorite dismutase family protein [unclassified Rhizobium]|uniref:chlorite dismutase family protein n=1 Tax=unclassified Rhizobium TaxID=2613769 RepID=UPI00161F8AB6|nr:MULTISPECIES: chlorite dismutase family protein [unclassified Rhizobium]MBB3320161.1 hypothetical protein [Rhizobium sp. BK181]MBB3544899.1 hypothetical protein [Rhizobium sp. BK399]MCS4095630.1 hypothetical protein [Rhizobium sp. BK176]